MALMTVMLLVSVFTIVLMASISFTNSSYKEARRTKSESQVYNVARAGLVDAINYFKRQASQPVEKFRPTYNSAVPTKGDTNDPYTIDPGSTGGKLHEDDSGGGPSDKPHLGIVQEFLIDATQNLWGRYEIGKITRLEKDSQGKLRNYAIIEYDSTGSPVVKAIPDAKSREWEGVRDVTANYAMEGKGLVWRIRSHGYVYRKDPAATSATRFYQYPNEVLSQIELETEIRRLQLTDYKAALRGNTGFTFVGSSRVKLNAPGGYALAHNPAATISGSPSMAGDLGLSTQDNRQLDFNEIFAISDAQTLASMADVNVTDLSQLPMAMSTMALTYIKPNGGTALFDVSRPLNGGGILVVDGNLVMGTDSASSYSGYIFVNGNLEMNSTCFTVGQVVVNGTVKVSSPSDRASLDYNTGLIGEIRRQLGQYRERRSGTRIL